MPSFQLRYTGIDAPDPETILVANPAEALEVARRRLAATGSVSVTLYSNGAVTHVLNPLVEAQRSVALGFSDPETDRKFAFAGIYAFVKDNG